jgi:site-specific DNA recombinase
LIKDLDARGILTTYGKPWTRAGLRQVLSRPLNAGLVEFKGRLSAHCPASLSSARRTTSGCWPPMRPGRPPSPAYLCSGSVFCGRCGKPLAGRPRINMKHYPDGEVRREYWCCPTSGRGGCGRIAIDQRALDAHAAELAIAVLSDAELANAAETVAAEAEAAGAELDVQMAKAEELRVNLADRLGRGELELDVFGAAVGPLDRRLAKLRDQRKALGTAPARIPADSEAAWRTRWADADPQERPSLLKLALRGRHLVVGPADPARRTDVSARVTLDG